jgi:hypothetical protein
VLERPLGVDLEVNLAPHPNFRGRLTFSTFRGSSLILEAGSAGDVYVFIEDWPIGDSRRKRSRRHSRGTLGHVYLVDSRGQKNVTPERTFTVGVSQAHELLVELCPQRPWARHVRVTSSTGRLSIHPSASNVVQFTVEV